MEEMFNQMLQQMKELTEQLQYGNCFSELNVLTESHSR